jgi:hypothetical protein
MCSRHDVDVILLKLALNTQSINQSIQQHFIYKKKLCENDEPVVCKLHIYIILRRVHLKIDVGPGWLNELGSWIT